MMPCSNAVMDRVSYSVVSKIERRIFGCRTSQTRHSVASDVSSSVSTVFDATEATELERDTERIQVEMGMCAWNHEIVDGTFCIKVIR